MAQAETKRRHVRTRAVDRPRIAAVEDDADFQLILRRWLTQDYDLALLSNGEELFQELDLLSPDLVMLDLQLPGPDGLLLCHRLRRHPRISRVPILIVTGRADDDAFLGAIEVGATSFLRKPVTKAELLKRLAELL